MARTAGRALILLDFEGVLFAGDRALPHAGDFVQRTSSTSDIMILSNSSRHSSAEMSAMLQSLSIAPARIIDGSLLTITALKADNHTSIFAMGSPGFIQDLRNAGFTIYTMADHGPEAAETVPLKPDVTAIVCGDDFEFEFERITVGFRYASEQHARLYSVGKDRQFLDSDGPGPANFTFAVPIAASAGIEPVVIGKPNPEYIGKLLSLESWKEVWVVGDNFETDIEFAHKIGAKSILVKTGVSDDDDVRASQTVATFVGANLIDAANWILR
jgi:HAD superfamily hydrolase (TIGR01450 family)